LGGEESVEEIIKDKEIIRLGWPLSRIKLPPPQYCGKSYLHRCKQGALQYVLIRPVTAVIAVILEATHYCCDGKISFSFGWLYITIVLFVSVTLAMYSLVCLYTNLSADLKPYRPLLQFGSVKFVIFFSFWQSVVIAGLVKVDVIKATTYWTADNVAEGIQDFMICGEMLLVSIVHMKAFTWTPYIAEERTPLFKSFLRAINVIDVAKDTQKHFVSRNALTVTVAKYDFKSEEQPNIENMEITIVAEKSENDNDTKDSVVIIESAEIEKSPKSPKKEKKQKKNVVRLSDLEVSVDDFTSKDIQSEVKDETSS